MKCPACGCDDDKVLESRIVRDGLAIRRRRSCLQCGRRFTTYEEIMRDSTFVVKRDGRMEEFSRAKLANGIERSLLKRPVSMKKIDFVIDKIIEELDSRFDAEIPSKAIGDIVMAELLALDEVAYVRYASIYRHYEDIDQFIKEVQSLRKPAAQSAESKQEAAKSDEAEKKAE